MKKKHSYEELTLFPPEEGSPFVSNPAPFAGQELGTYAASCTYEAAVKNTHFKCPLAKCPQWLLKCF